MGNSNLICHQCIAEDGKWVCADSHRYVTITESGYPRAQATSAECKGNQATTLLSRRSPGSVSQEVSGSVGQLLFSERPEYSNGAFEGAATIVTEKTTLMPFIVGLALGPNCLPLAITVSPDDDPSVLTIDDVFSPGLIADWNKLHSDTLTVCRGDIIIGVNNFTGTGREMLELLANIEGLSREEMLLLHIKPGANRTHPLRRSITSTLSGNTNQTLSREELQKISEETGVMLTEGGDLRQPFIVDGQLWPGNMNLGISISVDDHPSNLRIEALWSSGLLAEWNSTHPDAGRVCKGDYISSINKIGGHPEMLDEIDRVSKISIHHNTELKLRIEPGRGESRHCPAAERRAPVYY